MRREPLSDHDVGVLQIGKCAMNPIRFPKHAVARCHEDVAEADRAWQANIVAAAAGLGEIDVADRRRARIDENEVVHGDGLGTLNQRNELVDRIQFAVEVAVPPDPRASETADRSRVEEIGAGLQLNTISGAEVGDAGIIAGTVIGWTTVVVEDAAPIAEHEGIVPQATGP